MKKGCSYGEIYQIIVLKYLCSRFLNYDTRKYIPTKELINNLKYRTGKAVSMQYFRTHIIAKLRDEGVIIASSPKGYKIPSGEGELYDFINHGTTIIMPMLARLKKCRDNIKLGTDGRLDLFDNPEYKTLKQFFDNKDSDFIKIINIMFYYENIDVNVLVGLRIHQMWTSGRFFRIMISL